MSRCAHDAEIQTLVCICVTAKERRGDFYVVSSMRTLFLNNESLIYVSSSLHIPVTRAFLVGRVMLSPGFSVLQGMLCLPDF